MGCSNLSSSLKDNDAVSVSYLSAFFMAIGEHTGAGGPRHIETRGSGRRRRCCSLTPSTSLKI